MWSIDVIKSWFVVQERALTLAEIALAQRIFAQHLDYAAIRLVAHRAILRHYALSPNGSVYFHPSDYCADFATQSLSTQSWFIHELVHVWQFQQGVRVFRQAVFNRRYRYVLDAGKHFYDYGVEQQAQMVQDYFIKHTQGKPCEDLAACIPFIKNNQF